MYEPFILLFYVLITRKLLINHLRLINGNRKNVNAPFKAYKCQPPAFILLIYVFLLNRRFSLRGVFGSLQTASVCWTF